MSATEAEPVTCGCRRDGDSFHVCSEHWLMISSMAHFAGSQDEETDNKAWLEWWDGPRASAYWPAGPPEGWTYPVRVREDTFWSSPRSRLCVTCGAPAAAACVSRTGKVRRPHRSRLACTGSHSPTDEEEVIDMGIVEPPTSAAPQTGVVAPQR